MQAMLIDCPIWVILVAIDIGGGLPSVTFFMHLHHI